MAGLAVSALPTDNKEYADYLKPEMAKRLGHKKSGFFKLA
jgi:hypothetical protein